MEERGRDYHHWPEAWATESLAAARTAFAGITYGALTQTGRGGSSGSLLRFPLTMMILACRSRPSASQSPPSIWPSY